MSETRPVPEGFHPLNRGGPFVRGALGPLYYRKDDDTHVVIAMHIEEEHTNMRGMAHGGMLATLADAALSIGMAIACDGQQSFITANLTIDYVDGAYPGDWVEGHVDIQRVGKRFAFANCYLHVDDRRILRASGVFAVMPALNRTQLSEG